VLRNLDEIFVSDEVASTKDQSLQVWVVSPEVDQRIAVDFGVSAVDVEDG